MPYSILKDCLCDNRVLRMRLFTLRSVTEARELQASERSVDGLNRGKVQVTQ